MKKKFYHSHVPKWIVLMVLAAVTLPGIGAAEELHADGLSAQDIIERMSDAYAKSNSYRDSGVVKIVFINATGRRTVEKPFTTAFIRPDRFRFEYREKKPGVGEDRYIIHREGTNVQVYWSVDEGLKFESLDRAVAAATGISGESAITVPAMLHPGEITWRRSIRFQEPKRIDDAIYDTVNCFRIHDLIFGSPATFWIEKQTFMLRKIYREQEFEDFRAHTITTYKPLLNGTVTDKMLEFDQPKKN